jgi:hypothetical protein
MNSPLLENWQRLCETGKQKQLFDDKKGYEMGCKICGRGSCMSSFHSLEEQEKYEKYASIDDMELIAECVDKDNEIEDMKNRATELEAALKIQDQGIKYE